MSHHSTEVINAGDPSEQQYPKDKVMINDGEMVINKTSWEPSGKNKIEHRHQKHPDEQSHNRKN